MAGGSGGAPPQQEGASFQQVKVCLVQVKQLPPTDPSAAGVGGGGKPGQEMEGGSRSGKTGPELARTGAAFLTKPSAWLGPSQPQRLLPERGGVLT